ncbi:MAG: hypothetical protein AB1390_09315 [Nitrospirota bacterium]
MAPKKDKTRQAKAKPAKQVKEKKPIAKPEEPTAKLNDEPSKAVETSGAEEPKVKTSEGKAKAKEFVSVIYDGKEAEFPITALCEFTIVNSASIPLEYSDYVVLSKKEGKEQRLIYVEPSVFEKHILKQDCYTLNDAERVRQDVLSSLHELKSAWVKLGTAVMSVQIPRLYLKFGYETFEEYCEKELKLHRTTVYEIINSTLLIMRHKPEVYTQLMKEKKQADKALPSYHSLAMLKKKQKQLEKSGKFTDLLDQLLNEGLSTRDLETKIKEVLGKGEKKLSLKDMSKRYEALYLSLKAMEDVPESLVEAASGLAEELKKLSS